MKLEKKVAQWLREGIIDDEQVRKILEIEHSTGRTHWSQVGLYAFVILGGCVVSIGIISLIAANWEFIPDAIKLGVAFFALAGLGGGIYHAEIRDLSIVYDVLSTVFIFWCLATIGLISQIFHTSGQIYTALFYWLIVVLPLSVLGKRGFLTSVWVIASLINFLVWSLNKKSWWAKNFLIDDNYLGGDNLFPIFAIIAMGAICIASICGHFRKLSWFSSNFWFLGLSAGILSVGAGDIYCFAQEHMSHRALFPGYVLLPVSVASIMTQKHVALREKMIVCLFLCSSLAIYWPSFVLANSYDYGNKYSAEFQLLGAAYFIVSISFFAFYFAIRKHYWLFHAMVILIGIRFLIIYFQVFGDLAYTGFGLVASGLLIIGLAVAWYKYRPQLERWIKGLVQ